ncbi:MAG: hypothetical protein IJD40_10780 [Lachnospiraceae bacterium]|nr:hypothetical protein [Lachnospiraceae bacterium]
MKRMIHIISTLIVLMMLVLNFSFTSNAYTEEEKQQAKAWLSAHGYSPDMGGASQAYQDYLNGKFDEELGIDVNGDGIPASTESSTEQSGANVIEDNQEEADDEMEEAGLDETEEVSSGDSGVESVGESSKGETDNVDSTTAAKEEDRSTQEMLETISIEDSMDEVVNEESTFYRLENKDVYQEAGLVIILSVLIMLLLSLGLKKFL